MKAISFMHTKFLGILLGSLLLGGSQLSTSAATVMMSHSGDTDPLSAPVKWNASNANSNVEVGSYNDEGVAVWRIYDPGYSNNTNSKSSGLYYTKTFDNTQKNSLLTSGWTLSAVLKVPDDDPTDGADFNASSDIWVGFGFDLLGTSDPIQRVMFAFMFGKKPNGNMTVQLYGGGSGNLVELSPDYHKYFFEYHPDTQTVSVYIDDVYWREYAGSRTNPTSAGATLIYFGDNNAQSGEQVARTAYYKEIKLSVVPEPSKYLFCLAGLAGLMLMRRR